MSALHEINLIGAGNLGLHLGVALKNAGYVFNCVYSRSEEKAQKASEILNCDYTTELSKLPKASLIIISVPDNAISETVKKLYAGNAIVLHTSGSTNSDILAGCAKHYGVLYPLQTFSANRDVNFKDIPVFLEASDEITKNTLIDICKNINSETHFLNSEKRKVLHLAAVFACNFSNYMIGKAENILKHNNISTDYIKPLVKETFLKAIETGANNSQTGPAVRGDTQILQKHIELLQNDEDSKEIYEMISRLIIKDFKKKN